MMKKSCLWMPAAILACGLAASSCSKDDDPVTSADPVAPAATEQTQYEEMPAQPTADQLTTKITRPAFVFAGDYTGEGKALVARAVNAVGIDRAEVVIMPGAQVSGLTEEQLHSIVAVLANEGTVVFVEPEVDVIDDFCMKAAGVVGDYERLFDAEDASVDALLRIMEWSEVSPFAALADEDGAKDCYEIIALRAKTVYASMNEREGTDSKQTINVEADKEGAEGEYDILPVEVEYGNDFSDDYFGEKTDDLAEWINSEEPEVTEEEVTEARQIIQHRAAADAASLQNLSKNQTFINNGTNQFMFKTGIGSGESYCSPIQLRYEVWTAYAPDKKQDYYCVKLSVTAENEKLGCGPKEASKWINPEYDPVWQI